jgi:magnesium-transporting ATPase (P-type)
MENKLKLHHQFLPYLLIPICGLIIFSHGYIGYATITEKSDINGTLYLHYKLTKEQFYSYNFTIAFIATLLAFFQLKHVLQDNPKLLTKTFWAVAIFILLLILTYDYIETRLALKF